MDFAASVLDPDDRSAEAASARAAIGQFTAGRRAKAWRCRLTSPLRRGITRDTKFQGKEPMRNNVLVLIWSAARPG